MRAAETALFHPTPGCLRDCVRVQDFIDRHRAGINLSRELLAATDVVRPARWP